MKRKRLVEDGDGFAENSSYLLALNNANTNTNINTNRNTNTNTNTNTKTNANTKIGNG